MKKLFSLSLIVLALASCQKEAYVAVKPAAGLEIPGGLPKMPSVTAVKAASDLAARPIAKFGTFHLAGAPIGNQAIAYGYWSVDNDPIPGYGPIYHRFVQYNSHPDWLFIDYEVVTTVDPITGQVTGLATIGSLWLQLTPKNSHDVTHGSVTTTTEKGSFAVYFNRFQATGTMAIYADISGTYTSTAVYDQTTGLHTKSFELIYKR